MPDWMNDWFRSLESLSWWEILAYAAITAFVVQFVVARFVLALTRRTETGT